jgi:hypothetical protein
MSLARAAHIQVLMHGGVLLPIERGFKEYDSAREGQSGQLEPVQSKIEEVVAPQGLLSSLRSAKNGPQKQASDNLGQPIEIPSVSSAAILDASRVARLQHMEPGFIGA